MTPPPPPIPTVVRYFPSLTHSGHPESPVYTCYADAHLHVLPLEPTNLNLRPQIPHDVRVRKVPEELDLPPHLVPLRLTPGAERELLHGH